MDYSVTVRTYTGAVKTLEVLNMPDMEAAKAEAIAMTFGQVLSIEELGGEKPQGKPKPKKRKLRTIEKELKPGETENIITSWNNNPLSIFSNIDIGM